MNQTRIIEKYRLKKTIRKKLKQLLLTILLVLITLISIKKNPSLKEQIKENIYMKDNISLKAKQIYQKYFSSKEENKEVTEPVHKEILPFKSITSDKEGVKLTFSSIYPTPVLESGVLVYLDEDKVVLEQIDGIRATYQNVNIKDYKLYDYIEKGDILGETKTKELILSFQKEGEIVDYKNYI